MRSAEKDRSKEMEKPWEGIPVVGNLAAKIITVSSGVDKIGDILEQCS